MNELRRKKRKVGFGISMEGEEDELTVVYDELETIWLVTTDMHQSHYIRHFIVYVVIY